MRNDTNSFVLGNFAAGADLSARQYRFGKLSAGAVVVTGDGESALGIIDNHPALGGAVALIVGGTAKLEMAESCSAGALLTSAANGRGRVCSPAFVNIGDPSPSEAPLRGDKLCARALADSTGAGDYIEVLLIPGGAMVTA